MIIDRKALSEMFDRETLKVWFEALDDTRDSGQVNMGASANILRNSGLEKAEAQAVSRAWMATFKQGVSVEQRVEEALDEVYHLLKH